VKIIKLTQGKQTMVDDDIFKLIGHLKWCARKGWDTFYASRMFKTKDGKFHVLLLHHVIAGYPLNGLMVDHIDGNGLNNLRSNLRIVTRSQNGMNRKARKNTSSGFKGVQWREDSQVFRAYIRINGKRINLGNYQTAEEAFECYQAAATKYFGEYSKTN
jgi:hypothetical protein